MTKPGVERHYGQDDLTARITSVLERAGRNLDGLHPDDLAGVDEFHLGGRVASNAVLAALPLNADSRVLDVGCGIGGPARTIASSFGCAVTGVDLTAEFVQTAIDLSAAVGLGTLTSFEHGNALALPFPDAHFDAVTMFHVGMNISDKAALFTELARVVRPGGYVIVYDIMRVGDGETLYPVPWASDATISFVVTPTAYRDAMLGAGLAPDPPVDHLDLIRRAVRNAADNPAPVNLSHLMGANWPEMFGNLVAALDAGVVSPTQIVARRGQRSR